MKFEKLFGFIKNKILRGHMSDVLSSSIDFSELAEQYPEPTRSIFYKTVIIQLASLIEACLHYALLELKFTSYRSDWQYTDIKILHEINSEDKIQIIAGKRFKKKISLEGYVDFAVINKFCRDEAKLYGDDLYNSVDAVRKLRNKVHLMSLSELDKKYSKKQVDTVAELANKVLDIIEKNLK